MNPVSSGWRARDARTEYEQHHRGPNMTPMVDVVMVILIFFMASTVILGPEMLLAAGLEAEPDPRTPGADPRFAIDDPVFEIAIGVGESGIAVSGLGMDGATLTGFNAGVRAFADEAGTDGARMVLAPSDEVPYEAVIRVQDLLREAGFDRVGLR